MVVKVGNAYFPIDPYEVYSFFLIGQEIIIRMKVVTDEIRIKASSEAEARLALQEMISKFEFLHKKK